MFSEIWRRVAMRRFDTAPATLRGYCIRRVRDDLYPVDLSTGDAVDSSTVNGLVYLDVDEATFERLDQYESPFYDRVEVAVDLQEGVALACQGT